jgi:hypothetical protein
VSDPLTDATAGTWHDHAPAVAESARVRLRLREDDPDARELEDLARAAMRAIDERLALRAATGRYSYPVSDSWALVTYGPDGVPADVLEAARQLTVELLRRRDAPFGVLDAHSPTGEAVRVSADQLRGVQSLLEPHMEGWGIA